jgi:hypothetical protein
MNSASGERHTRCPPFAARSTITHRESSVHRNRSSACASSVISTPARRRRSLAPLRSMVIVRASSIDVTRSIPASAFQAMNREMTRTRIL